MNSNNSKTVSIMQTQAGAQSQATTRPWRAALAGLLMVLPVSSGWTGTSQIGGADGTFESGLAGIDVGTYVRNAQRGVEKGVNLPPGYSIIWSGQFAYMEAALVSVDPSFDY